MNRDAFEAAVLPGGDYYEDVQALRRASVERTGHLPGISELEVRLVAARRHLAAAQRLRVAVLDEGPEPLHHRRTMQRHRAEWPVLWDAIDAVIAEALP